MNPLTNIYGVPTFDFEVGALTTREIEVMQRTLLPDRNIAIDLQISYHTVMSHLKNIRNKTGMHNKEHMVYFALKKGLIN